MYLWEQQQLFMSIFFGLFVCYFVCFSLAGSLLEDNKWVHCLAKLWLPSVFFVTRKESPHGVNTWSYYIVAEQQEKLTNGKLIDSL